MSEETKISQRIFATIDNSQPDIDATVGLLALAAKQFGKVTIKSVGNEHLQMNIGEQKFLYENFSLVSTFRMVLARFAVLVSESQILSQPEVKPYGCEGLITVALNGRDVVFEVITKNTNAELSLSIGAVT